MTLFCNLFMERPSYDASVIERHTELKVSQVYKY